MDYRSRNIKRRIQRMTSIIHLHIAKNFKGQSHEGLLAFNLEEYIVTGMFPYEHFGLDSERKKTKYAIYVEIKDLKTLEKKTYYCTKTEILNYWRWSYFNSKFNKSMRRMIITIIFLIALFIILGSCFKDKENTPLKRACTTVILLEKDGNKITFHPDSIHRVTNNDIRTCTKQLFLNLWYYVWTSL